MFLHAHEAPDHRPTFTRREFLHAGMALVSTAATLPLFLDGTAQVLAAEADGALVSSRPGVPEERILVVVQLSGGNDGLNTVVPFQQDAYYRARPALGIPAEQVLRLDGGAEVGLHPQMGALKTMIEEGRAAVVQGVGYPNPNRSHFVSMDIWHTGDTLGGRGKGWIGRATDHLHEQAGGRLDPTTCIALGREAPLAAQGRHTAPIAFEAPARFRWTAGGADPALGAAYDAINRAGVLPGTPSAAQGDNATFLMRTALDAQLASDRILRATSAAGSPLQGRGNLAGQLQMVAAMIRADLPTRIYYVALGGFDTHANQPFQHGRLLEQFATAAQGFYQELDRLGQADRVLTFAFSEFGRRVRQNASNGTDHGAAGPVFLFGPMVQPGVIGPHPSLERLDQGDLAHHTDFRGVYAAILDRWMKIDSAKVLGRSWQPAAVVRAKG